jgi:serine/threonine protein kinase
VIDFGICQIDEEGAFRTTVDEAFGSREFAAPEMDRGSPHAVSEKSDVYSLGKVLYFALSGGKFISREAIDERTWLDLPSPRGVERGHVRRLITRMVAASPDDRLSSAEALREIERAGTLMRSGVSAVGSRDQLCPACRVGSLERRKDEGNLGFREIGNPSRDVRLLWCNYCGFLRRHFIDGTQSQRDGLWEI